MEGRLAFREFETWYRVVGEVEAPGRLPLLVLHGGPGSSHDPLEGLGALAEQGRRVVFYDQLGGGDSDKPDDPALWTVDTFLEQLCSVREALGRVLWKTIVSPRIATSGSASITNRTPGITLYS